jgi:hypothetical protein
MENSENKKKNYLLISLQDLVSEVGTDLQTNEEMEEMKGRINENLENIIFLLEKLLMNFDIFIFIIDESKTADPEWVFLKGSRVIKVNVDFKDRSEKEKNLKKIGLKTAKGNG